MKFNPVKPMREEPVTIPARSSFRYKAAGHPFARLSWLFCSVLCALAFAAWAQYSIDWHTMDGGGGVSTGSVYTVSGTIGQPDTGTMSGGTYSISGGFWSFVAAVQTPGGPWLRVIRTTTNAVVVAWPNPSTGFTLQQNSDLTSGAWTNTITTPIIVGDEKQLIVAPPVGNRFYRLYKP